MRWTPGERSSNIEDRRASGGMGGKSLGIGGTVVVLVLSLVFGRNLFTDLGVTPGAGTAVGAHALSPADSIREEHEADFASVVLDSTQKTWAGIFRANNQPYHDAKLVLFRNATESGCGPAQTAMGPFYCPLDEKVYIDLGFFDELSTRFGASGEFAQAYVLAHELGHHVQHLLGTDDKVRQLQQRRSDLANPLSVRLELQADCYAGIWAHETQQRGLLDAGDIDIALNAASAVGDDRIQQRETGEVNVDAFTHGSAQQRSMWFRRGFDGGTLSSCDTFASTN